MTKMNGLCSDSGMLSIIWESECKKASDVVYKQRATTYRGSRTLSSYPKGCFLSHSRDGEAPRGYLNDHSLGSRNQNSQSICLGNY